MVLVIGEDDWEKRLEVGVGILKSSKRVHFAFILLIFRSSSVCHIAWLFFSAFIKSTLSFLSFDTSLDISSGFS